MSHIIMIFTLVVSLLSFPTSLSAADFCIAKLKGAATPYGHTCRTTTPTVDDFVFTGLRNPGNTSSSPRGSAVTPGLLYQFPALNGLGLGIARLDLAPNGVVPLHTHSAASEIIFVVSGRVTAGFISSNNVAYVKTLIKGDVMLFPQGLLHFIVNAANATAQVIFHFSNPDPGLQLLDLALFGGDLPSSLLVKATLFDAATIKKLKAALGGTG
ncbi:germin-like protein 1 [Euphorbia peplus]|nr:germin-like protein 1 [Euphorbia peplus]